MEIFVHNGWSPEILSVKTWSWIYSNYNLDQDSGTVIMIHIRDRRGLKLKATFTDFKFIFSLLSELIFYDYCNIVVCRYDVILELLSCLSRIESSADRTKRICPGGLPRGVSTQAVSA